MADKTYTSDDFKAVILVGGRDFGRCPIASRLNRVLWPVAGKPVLQHLIEHIASQGIRRFVLCCENHSGDIQKTLNLPDYLDVRYTEETMPRGTAGSIRDAADPDRDELLFVFGACTVTPPDIHEMIRSHHNGSAEMTMFFNPVADADNPILHEAQLYICEPTVLEYIPRKGYFDIKEGLVPSLVAAGKSVFAAELTAPAGNYKGWRQYLHVMGLYLEKLKTNGAVVSGYRTLESSRDVWVGEGVTIDPSAQVTGPVMIDAGAHIEAGAVVIGPSVIGKNAIIGKNTFVENSTVWEQTVIGRDCQIRNCLIDRQRTIRSGLCLDSVPVGHPQGWFDALCQPLRMRIKHARQALPEGRTVDEAIRHPRQKWVLPGISVLLLAALIVTYWRPTVVDLWNTWMRSDEYSSGLLVPFLAAYVIWSQRKRFLDSPVKPAITGLLMLLAAQVFRLLGLYYMFASAERLAMVISIGGIVLVLYGWRFFWRFVPIFLFLFLMLPLPKRVESMITLPLQHWATVSAVFSLETLGYSVIREGNIIRIGDTVVAVAEACNGLRMLTAFFVISGFVVLISNRKCWEKAVLLISTIPIALFCNTIRLTLTSIAFTMVHTETLENLFHDFGGLAMMPFAIGLILLEMWLMKVLFSPPEIVQHQVILSRNSR